MPLPLIVCCISKIQIGFSFLTWVVQDKGPLNGCVCVLVAMMYYIIIGISSRRRFSFTPRKGVYIARELNQTELQFANSLSVNVRVRIMRLRWQTSGALTGQLSKYKNTSQSKNILSTGIAQHDTAFSWQLTVWKTQKSSCGAVFLPARCAITSTCILQKKIKCGTWHYVVYTAVKTGRRRCGLRCGLGAETDNDRLWDWRRQKVQNQLYTQGDST